MVSQVIDIMIKNKQQIVRGKKVLPNTLTLTCSECGSKQTYCNKYSYRRAMGVGSDQTQKNRGLCGKCSRSAKRKGWTLSPEQVKRMRETAIKHQTPYDSIEEWEVSKRKKKDYYDAVDDMSRSNLRLYNPKEYKRYMDNRWDGTNYETGLTIEHITPKSVCFEVGLTISQTSHINNLEVISMKDNNGSWKQWDANRKLNEKRFGHKKYKEKYLTKEDVIERIFNTKG